MLFLYYVLSLLFIIMQYVHARSEESELINKIIGDILAKAERKNTEPIQFTWSDRFTADYKQVTPHYKEVRELNTVITEDCERILNEKNDCSTSLKILKDIMKTTDTSVYTIKRALETKTEGHITTRKANHSSKSKAHYRPHTTSTTNLKSDERKPIIEETTSTYTDTTTQKITTKARHNPAIYITRIAFSGTRGRIFSRPIFDSTKQLTTGRTTTVNIIEKTTASSTSTTTSTRHLDTPITTKLFSKYSPRTTTESIEATVESDNEKYDQAVKEPSEDREPKENWKLNKKKMSVIKAIEDLINSIPNYNVHHEEIIKYEDIIKKIAPINATATTVASGALINKPKHGLGAHFFHILAERSSTGFPNVIFSNLSSMIEIATIASTPIISSELNSHILPSTNSHILPSTDSNTELDSIQQSEIDNSDSDSNSSKNKITLGSAQYDISTTDLYLLVDEKNKELKGFFTIKPEKIVTGEVNNKIFALNDNHLAIPVHHKVENEKHKPKWKQRNGITNNPVLELYNEIDAYNVDIANTNYKLEQKKAKETAWERLMKFFGHDRVCNCKCVANRTMCKVCTATDRVMRELTFEFTNLAKYMNDHCMEIQTFFWMNPSGGKKLRDTVHRIDKSLHDYYKRVRGKCKGRTCKTFATYLDKRHNTEHLTHDPRRHLLRLHPVLHRKLTNNK